MGRTGSIEEFRHVQRHPINPKERLTTFGVSEPLGNDPDRLQVKSWLVDDAQHVRNWGTFVVRRAGAGASAARTA